MNKFKVNREKWRDTYYYIARNNLNEISGRVKVKNVKFNLEGANQIFNKYGTFKKGSYKERIALKNVYEVQEYIKTDNINKFKPEQVKTSRTREKAVRIQYFVIGRTKRGTIGARSPAFPSSFKPKSRLIELAWDKFYRNLAGEYAGVSDANEGEILSEKVILSIKQGWVYYTPIPD